MLVINPSVFAIVHLVIVDTLRIAFNYTVLVLSRRCLSWSSWDLWNQQSRKLTMWHDWPGVVVNGDPFWWSICAWIKISCYVYCLLSLIICSVEKHHVFDSFNFSKHFILVKDKVDLKSIPETMGMRQECTKILTLCEMRSTILNKLKHFVGLIYHILVHLCSRTDLQRLCGDLKLYFHYMFGLISWQ